MSLDKIVVFVLALMFFGGLALVFWKSRRDEKRGGPVSSSAVPDGIEADLKNKIQAKERKTSQK